MNTKNPSIVSMQSLFHRLYLQVMSIDLYESIAIFLIKLLIWYILAKIVIKFGTSFIQRVFQHRALRLNERRNRTLQSLVINVLRYVVYFLLIMAILEALNIPVTTLLAGAGVVGVAIGFGAQNLVRDVITGFFIIFEDQFAVGDSIQTGQFRGTVEEFGLRITKLRAWTGEIYILPNSSITQVTNFSNANSLAVIDVGVSYNEDLDRVFDVIKDVMLQAKIDVPDMIGEPQVMGVQSFGASEVVIRSTVECNPLMNYSVQREIFKRIKGKFDEVGIEIPYPHQVLITSSAIEKKSDSLTTELEKKQGEGS
ncbi:mechanosensitive ion channel family protein [Fodinisporobacter ferrooxydans]|uniref:Mechanosensitive ion channel family protein n=1 Tax=Fodinisporobacter ferrooxydans TaxID=2901836 RepID=A0ABY4CQ93_9BACL|nr:mechanosensitive ion channel family protein [Alicyclobacillaceae bacterium MYW30-H2]